MKHSKHIILWLLLVLLTLPGANTQAETEDFPCAFSYQEVLNRYHTLLAKEDAEGDGVGETGVWEAKMYPTQGTPLDSVGYAIVDVSGDGMPELLIGAITRHGEGRAYGNEIYALYACKENEPQLTFEGWGRSRHSWMGDGKFFYQGSGGAAFSMFGTYSLSSDGTNLICNDLYFTQEKENNVEELGLYHNQSGSTEPAASEELTISEGQFWQMEAKLEQLVQDMVLTPFAEYVPSPLIPANDMPLQAHWAESIADIPAGYTEYKAAAEPLAKVLFTASHPVKDVRLLALTPLDMNGSHLVFDIKEVYRQDQLTAQQPLLAHLVFYGDLPNNGISFVEENGSTRYFTVEISGENGELMLHEFWQ